MKKIVQDGDPVLRQIAAAVPEEDFDTEELYRLVDDMAEALDSQSDGVAIAAPQIGVSKRIFVVRYDRLVTPPEGVAIPAEIGVFINPKFVRVSSAQEEMDEGCLSVRGLYGKTIRHSRAMVRARLPDGRTFEMEGDDILAQVFQHETDHLEGVLFVDHAHDIVEAEVPDSSHE